MLYSRYAKDCIVLYSRLTINNSKIPIKDSVKYIGPHFDKRLTWEEHIKAEN